MQEKEGELELVRAKSKRQREWTPAAPRDLEVVLRAAAPLFPSTLETSSPPKKTSLGTPRRRRQSRTYARRSTRASQVGDLLSAASAASAASRSREEFAFCTRSQGRSKEFSSRSLREIRHQKSPKGWDPGSRINYMYSCTYAGDGGLTHTGLRPAGIFPGSPGTPPWGRDNQVA